MLREYLEKGHSNCCTNKVKRLFTNYNNFEAALKEAFSNPDKEQD